MNLTHDGITLWFGTPDAPAPSGELADIRSAGVTVAMTPANHANAVDVRYRVDGGPVRSVPGRQLRTDYPRGVQYFKASFPGDLLGEKVEYCPIGSCSGRQVPRHGSEDRMLSVFTLAKKATPRCDPGGGGPAGGARFSPDLKYLGQVSVQLERPVVIGETPHGLRLDFHIASGTLSGAGVNARVRDAMDYMLVRRDGVGEINVHATLETDDGATFTAAYTGLIEFGEDGHARMSSGNYPKLPKLQLTPRLYTEHPRYRWLNRRQLLGVGHADMRALVVSYDLYDVGTRLEPTGPRST